MGFGNLGVIEAQETATFLLNGKSLNLSKNTETGEQTVVRNNDIPLTTEEILSSGEFWNEDNSTIDFAKVVNWDQDNYLEIMGAPPEWVEETFNDPNAKNIFMTAAGEDPNNLSMFNLDFADAIEAGGLLKSIGGMNTGKAYGGAYDADPQSLVYPLNTDPDDVFDYLQIVGYEYIPGMDSKDWSWEFGNNSKRSDDAGEYTDETSSYGTLSTPSQRYTPEVRKKNILATVRLPMTSGISEANSVNWGNGDTLSSLQRGAANIASAGIAAVAGQETWEKFTQDFKGELGQMFGDIEMNQIKAFFAGQAVGANIFTRGTGMVLNPNLELLFNGPNLRTFQYTYNFTPREPAEAANIKNIIRFFKQNMAPKRSDGGTFLESPNIFQLKYLSGGEEHPFLNNIKLTALTGFNVNYTPSNQYMTYAENKSMTSYQVQMTFNELEPVLFNDFNDDADSFFTMGY